jgi:copper transport protein
MKRLAAGIVVLVALVAPASAYAHATLLKQFPSLRQELEHPPTRIVLEYDQSVDAVHDSILVLTAKGKNVAGPAKAITSSRELVAPVRKNLPRGAYTIRWRALSSDGHVVSGISTFGIGVPAPPVTAAAGASGPTRTEDVVRWLYFLSLALFVGAIGFRVLVLPRVVPEAVERRFYRLSLAGGVAALEVGILAFMLRAEDALQLPFVSFVYGDLSSLANGTRFGEAFIAMTLGFALVLALLVLGWLGLGRLPLWTALVLGLGFASGLSLSGHSAVDPGDSWISELADWAHLSAAILWVGGLVCLFVVVWPQRELRRDAFLRFSRLATVLVAVLLAAGTYLAILRLPHLHDLWTSGYGHVLLIKLSLVATALAWGAGHRWLAAPRLRAGADGGVLRRSLLGESAVAMAVLLLAAVLVDSAPPPQPLPPPPAAAARSGR